MTTPPKIQQYACVVCLDLSSQTISAVSDNINLFSWEDGESLLGRSLAEIFPPDNCEEILRCTPEECGNSILRIGNHPLWRSKKLSLRYFANGSAVVLEITRPGKWRASGGLNTALLELTEGVSKVRNNQELLNFLCRGLCKWVGFDRALAYRFDNQYNGLVVAEECSPKITPLLNVHFWERDVPADARDMQLREVVHYTYSIKSGLVGFTGKVVPEAADLIRSILPSRPGHEVVDAYLRDSKLGSQLGISLIVKGKLWGNMYAHTLQPLEMDHGIYTFCRVVARLAGSYIGFQSAMTAQEVQVRNQHLRSALQGSLMAKPSLAEGLIGGEISLLDIIPETKGGCVLIEGELRTIGQVPNDEQLRELITWLEEREMDGPAYYTDHLVGDYPPAADFVTEAAGILAVPTLTSRQGWMIWFRPEEIQTVIYGSPPDESEQNFEKRFRQHQGILKAYSYPWTIEEVTTAIALQQFIQDVVAQRYDEIREMNERLQQAYEEMESFSYTVSHDLRAPLRGIDGFAEILMEDYGEEINQDGKELISTIQENAARMNEFITDILELSRVGRSKLIVNPLPAGELVASVLADLERSGTDTSPVTIEGPLPTIHADERHLRMVLSNLITNALKYSSRAAEPKVVIAAEQRPDLPHPVLAVSDNGIGVAVEHRERIFDMFTRLVNAGEFEGTGVGLAIVKRVIRRHEGKVWVEEASEGGAKFLFYTARDITQE